PPSSRASTTRLRQPPPSSAAPAPSCRAARTPAERRCAQRAHPLRPDHGRRPAGEGARPPPSHVGIWAQQLGAGIARSTPSPSLRRMLQGTDRIDRRTKINVILNACARSVATYPTDLAASKTDREGSASQKPFPETSARRADVHPPHRRG